MTGKSRVEVRKGDFLGIEKAGKTPVQIELEWFEKHYRGDIPQLTLLRAVLIGAVLGIVMSLSNLYVGLKTGWGLGVAITAMNNPGQEAVEQAKFLSPWRLCHNV